MFKSLVYLASVCLLVGCLGDPKKRIEVANDATLNNEPKAPKKIQLHFLLGEVKSFCIVVQSRISGGSSVRPCSKMSL